MFKYLLISLMVISGCSNTIIVETDDEFHITYGGGGVLSKKRVIYQPLYDTDKKVIIDGRMISADAFYAFGVPGVCYTENAVWSPHAISANGVRLEDETDHITRYLPEPLANHFRASPFYWNQFTVPEIDYEELLIIWPEGACNYKEATQ